MKKVMSLILVIVMSFSVFSGCSGKDDDREVNDMMTQFYVGVFDGGLGTEWARKVADEFEAKYAETVYEPGKKGVQVWIEAKKLEYDPAYLIPNLQTNIEQNDVYYTSSAEIHKFINAGVCADITSTLNQKVYLDNGELSGNAKSIMDRMDPYFVEFYNFNKGGKYYGFPFEDTIQGLIYDHDLFVEQGLLDGKSGPDGKIGTLDDGLPQTMEDFYALLDFMCIKKGITPFTLSGETPFYFTSLTTAVVAQYEGAEKANSNLWYNGTHNGTEITEQNGYLLWNQQGKKEALKFLRKLVSDTRYHSKYAFGSSQNYSEAQDEFVRSVKIGDQRIAMLLDGDWWENEARGIFTEMAHYGDKYSYGKRDFRYLPMPNMTGQAGGTVFTGMGGGTLAFVNEASTHKDIAEKWIQFALSRKSIATFTTTTGAILPFEYDLEASEKAQLTKFSQNVWDVRHNPSYTIYRTSHASQYQLYGDLKMGGAGKELQSRVNNTDYPNALKAFYDNKSLTVEDYFNGMKSFYSESKWSSSYKRFIASYN